MFGCVMDHWKLYHVAEWVMSSVNSILTPSLGGVVLSLQGEFKGYAVYLNSLSCWGSGFM